MPLCQSTSILIQEVKALVRPEFEANPDKYYPTETFKKMGFSRSRCKCGHYYWRKSEKSTTCGDSKYLSFKAAVEANTPSSALDVGLDSKKRSHTNRLGIRSNDHLLQHVSLASVLTATPLLLVGATMWTMLLQVSFVSNPIV